jgi:lipopolysaccharide export system protein LptA
MKKLLLVVFCAGLAALVRAQTNSSVPDTAPPAAASMGTNAPAGPVRMTEITSDGGGYLDTKSNLVVFRIHVRVNDPRMKLTCELLTGSQAPSKQSKYEHFFAETNVVIDFFDQAGQTNHATADSAEYTYRFTNSVLEGITNSVTNEIVVLRGNPHLKMADGSTAESDPLTYDVPAGRLYLSGSGKAAIPVTSTNGPDFLQDTGPRRPKGTNDVNRAKPTAAEGLNRSHP